MYKCNINYNMGEYYTALSNYNTNKLYLEKTNDKNSV